MPRRTSCSSTTARRCMRLLLCCPSLRKRHCASRRRENWMTLESLPTIPPYIKKGVHEWRRRVEYRFLYLACEQDCVVDVPSVYHHPWMHDTSRILGTLVIQTASDRSSMSCGRSRKCTDMNQSLHQSISIFINKITLEVASTHEPPHETHQEESVISVVRE